MSQIKKIHKEKVNWGITIVLAIVAIVVILFPLYLTVNIALKDPSDMTNLLS